ncbi:N-acetylglucosamine kinase-like BadF-type ATPase [Mobilisporobacter senegalensis]|uniref:N-acetylglucosamine kinase-like BadF-type ATPase n=1 Tax=Mobilisporobacter senegalensis TaxID=1329262 RepID=A0A3N1XYS4_9FIRM|nr:BadF/BadG/BcrA/BcrD ATPase family protein [Mobilisporobacter senegalensis]ROR30392.1 N-acetylglucosamine kinase-like BadF-type ATPase [Mobilisporobacter senegalensis]
MWLLGLDAGGTKTHCVITDDKGSIVAEGFGGAGNYQVCGIEKTKESILKAIDEALNQSVLEKKNICHAVFGMAGADDEMDLDILNPLAHSIMGDVPVDVVNDTWIGLRSGADDNIGIVSICGTGAAHAGRNKKGESLILRNLDYELGNRGGGGDLVSSALHYAFRSNEGTYLKTSLEDEMKKIFKAKTMDDICYIIRNEEMSDEHRYQIPIAVFQTARKRDPVAVMLLEEMGQTLGQYASGVIKRLHLEDEKIPMVLIGSLFKTGEPLFINAYMKEVLQTAPFAYPVFPTKSPVMGAIGLIIDQRKGC